MKTCISINSNHKAACELICTASDDNILTSHISFILILWALALNILTSKHEFERDPNATATPMDTLIR